MSEVPRRRKRESRSKKREILEYWYHGSRKALMYKVPRYGEPKVQLLVPRDTVSDPSKEAASLWLLDYMPRLTLEQCYILIWGK